MERLLIIDDDALVRRVIRRVFRDREVVEACSVEEGLRLVGEGRAFDVVLCDLVMPEQTGMDFYRCLAERSPADAARVVFMSGGAVTREIADFLAATRNPAVEKPFDIHHLRQLVERLGARTDQADLGVARTG